MELKLYKWTMCALTCFERDFVATKAANQASSSLGVVEAEALASSSASSLAARAAKLFVLFVLLDELGLVDSCV